MLYPIELLAHDALILLRRHILITDPEDGVCQYDQCLGKDCSSFKERWPARGEIRGNSQSRRIMGEERVSHNQICAALAYRPIAEPEAQQPAPIRACVDCRPRPAVRRQEIDVAAQGHNRGIVFCLQFVWVKGLERPNVAFGGPHRRRRGVEANERLGKGRELIGLTNFVDTVAVRAQIDVPVPGSVDDRRIWRYFYFPVRLH